MVLETPKSEPAQRAAAASERARRKLKAQQDEQRSNLASGGLADSSVFHESTPTIATIKDEGTEASLPDDGKVARLAYRNMENLAVALNPRPRARNRWQQRMVWRHVQRGGRLTREMQIARTERKHVSKSHFMKTSMKKMMPLARQIAGKSIDEAILQMRFSKKRVAQQVLEHLVVARNEAVVVKGMGQATRVNPDAAIPMAPMILNPSTTVSEPHQTATKTLKKGEQASATDIYVAESWVNRGPYGKEPEYRARGRMNIRRPPHTGISVMLKEEKTRTREKSEKESRVIRRRLGKGAWNQLPDRPIIRQSQQVLW